MSFVRNLDLALLAVALPVFIVAGIPVLGWVVAAVVWALWRGIGTWSDRKAAASNDPKHVAGIAAGSMVGRGWLMGLILLAAGLLAGNDVGLSAAVLAVILFTVHFTFKLLLRPAEPNRPSTT
jgi:hypothetical protein